MVNTSSVAYLTILASNYLPKAIALADSMRAHEDAELHVLLIDVPTADNAPQIPGVRVLSTEFLGMGETELLRMATIYDLVEFATAVKPTALLRLLEDHDAAYYIDPDMYLTAPLVELPTELAASEGGILLTPHFLEPPGEDAPLTEGHLLNVGVYNLGFCGVDRRALPFLNWWKDRLRSECRFEPLSGLFVDQKWVDVGSQLFNARALRHAGYNTGVGNMHERPIGVDEQGALIVASTGDPLRLFHFHAFDPDNPTELSTRFKWSTDGFRESSAALDQLCVEYAAKVRANRPGTAPAYPYAEDLDGKPLSRHLRRSYRLQWDDQGPLPSPFRESDRAAWSAWRRAAWRQSMRSLAGDAAKSARVVLPEESERIIKRFPGLHRRLVGRHVDRGGLWG